MGSSFNSATVLVISSLITTVNAACCHDGWFAYNGHCYGIEMDIKLSFSDAKKVCELFGARLVELETVAENKFMKRYLKQIKAAQHFWIGLNDLSHEGIWRWAGTSKHATFSDWAPRQPNNSGNEDCVHFSHTDAYQWNDLSCLSKIGFLCEKESA